MHLWVATDAAASRANCLITLSSKYFCSHFVMSASRARIRSSFSLRCSMSAVALYSDGTTPLFWLPPWRWRGQRKQKMRRQKKNEELSFLDSKQHMYAVGSSPMYSIFQMWFTLYSYQWNSELSKHELTNQLYNTNKTRDIVLTWRRRLMTFLSA